MNIIYTFSSRLLFPIEPVSYPNHAALSSISEELKMLTAEGLRCGSGGRWMDEERPEVAVGMMYFLPNRQNGPESEFLTPERSAPTEVVMESLVFINNSICSRPDIFRHFVLWSSKKKNLLLPL